MNELEHRVEKLEARIKKLEGKKVKICHLCQCDINRPYACYLGTKCPREAAYIVNAND